MTTYGAGVQAGVDDRPPWHIRTLLWLELNLRPYLGWGVLVTLALLALLPSATLRVNGWVQLGSDQAILEALGPLSVITVWLFEGWRRPRVVAGRRLVHSIVLVTLILVSGSLILSQTLIGWIPEIGATAAAITGGTIPELVAETGGDWARLFTRFTFWWTGVVAGTATQDNLVFMALAGSIVWVVGAVSAVLARRVQNGFVSAAPLLWLLGLILLYSREGKLLFVVALGLAVLLHLLLDHATMLRRWGETGLDYSPGLFLDRFMLAIGAALLILTLAAAMPNLYVQPIVNRYYAEVQPIYETLENTAERLFPGAKGTARLGGGGLSGGMPNSFLLGTGQDLSDTVVMRVRTNDSAGYEYPYETAAPPAHYMRGGTLTAYDGLGWSNPPTTEREEVGADTQIAATKSVGRKEVIQQIAVTFNTHVLYAAPEPNEVSVDARHEFREPGDTVALWAREKSYTAVSLVPAVSEDALVAARDWGPDLPLPEGYEIHLALPDTIPERTMELALSITDDQPSMYVKARAIESLLRTYEYDLSVPPPSQDVTDVADYFLFDLRRGYCDYYATAFVVLARIAGLPARFATGFAPGNWNPEDGVWTITEADAHSWPEVYFPEFGWIPFEPTAGRPELVRIGAPLSLAASPAQPREELVPEPEAGDNAWNWQMLFWLLPLGALAWIAGKFARQRWRRNEDPWQGLIRWGGRAGRPLAVGETVLEYGDGLASFVVSEVMERQDTARVAATEIRQLCDSLSSERYAPSADKEHARASAVGHWQRLRDYLRALKLKR